MTPQRLMFLAWESPWPAHSGAMLRSLGLLTELGRAFEIELLVLSRCPLSEEQTVKLNGLTKSLSVVPLKDVLLGDKFRTALKILQLGYPYHSAVLKVSLQAHPEVCRAIEQFPGIVFTSVGHWGALVIDRPAPNWILNQCDADVEFWRVYASQTTGASTRLAARINHWLARKHFPRIYGNVGRIISVCEEDRQLTLALAPQAQVDVIENGVDCAYLTPDRTSQSNRPRLLFTGTSAGRNVTALRQFVCNTLPLIQQRIPNVELLVAGNFSPQAQLEFRPFSALRFTGRVEDMRPYFNQSHVFVAPFEETHGSKLKIAEAMAMAMPIVSTAQGVRGFALTHGQSALIADNNVEFASCCVALLLSSEYRERLGQAARQKALETIDWPVLGKRLVELVEDTINRLASSSQVKGERR